MTCKDYPCLHIEGCRREPRIDRVLDLGMPSGSSPVVIRADMRHHPIADPQKPQQPHTCA
jgi:hypothetical protein